MNKSAANQQLPAHGDDALLADRLSPCPGLCRYAAAVQDGSQYFVLLIITDGVISDMAQTKEAIVNVRAEAQQWMESAGLMFALHLSTLQLCVHLGG